jgi:hypothetical protein
LEESVKARAAVAKRFAGGRIPLVALSLFGVAEGDASQGLEVSAAACWVDSKLGEIRFQTGLGLQPVNPEANIASFLNGVDGRHFSKISLCPDQNSRRVIAWTENGVISVSRVVISGLDLVERRDSFAGLDCVLGFDGFLKSPESGEATDIIAFYLSADRKNLNYRLQFENFAIERNWSTFTVPVSLDVVARSENSLTTWVSPRNGTAFSVVSDPYPVHSSDNANLGVSLHGGVHYEVIVQRDPVLEGSSLGALLQAGTSFVTIVQIDPVLEGSSLGALLQAGVHFVTITQGDPILEGSSLGAQLQNGVSVDVVVDGGLYNEGSNLGVSLFGGSCV